MLSNLIPVYIVLLNFFNKKLSFEITSLFQGSPGLANGTHQFKALKKISTI